MPTSSIDPGHTPRSGRSELRGRGAECEILNRLLVDVRSGGSRALVMRGEAGIGKTALLDHLVRSAGGCRIVRAVGIESEMELAYAGLHQLCAPIVGSFDSLPEPQREALGTAFGLRTGGTPDRFHVGLAVLTLLADAARAQPLVCVVDDAQWLDDASLKTLAFVARRLLAESVALVFAIRSSGKDPLTGLTELEIHGLHDEDARILLQSNVTGPIDEQVLDRIVAETHGNPLALLELPLASTPDELAGGFGLPDSTALTGRIEDGYRRRLERLPATTRLLLLVAAAEPVGDPGLVWRAATGLGVGYGAAAPAVAAGLVDLAGEVRFHHPLVRSVVYRAASPEDRRDVHRALAEGTDPGLDQDRRAWHLAHATADPDDAVAAELEHSASRAQARGGLAAAAAFLAEAARLTRNPADRGRRALAAAQAKHQSGSADAALSLLAVAESTSLDELQRARAGLLRAQVASDLHRGNDAPRLLLDAARQLEPLDVVLARRTYLDALAAAVSVGRLAGDATLLDVAKAARAAPRPATSGQAPDLLLDGLSALVTEGRAVAAPILKDAVAAFRCGAVSTEDALRWLWLAGRVADDLRDDDSWHALAAHHLELARRTGALTVLPAALRARIVVHVVSGELDESTALAQEVRAVMDVTGTRLAPYGAVLLAAWRGHEGPATELVEATIADVSNRGEGMGLGISYLAQAVLYNGTGRYAEAFDSAERACAQQDLGIHEWSLSELVEAAVRIGRRDRAATAVEELAETARISGTDWARGAEADGRAMISDGGAAEDAYREALELLGRTRIRIGLARTHLTYGEWLRRQGRRVDAREQLRTAHGMFAAMGVDGFAERARRELLATGEKVRKRNAEASTELTAQEAQIARLVTEGRTNPEIAAELFISARTVEWHLHKVFDKLGVSSRKELRARN
ncbi:DNA-binding CsgD family transcriptional regulator [Rhodococcus sp. LBL1]|nr:DNA-binding CsgD family transcriptional regulator [Rhodococcus sp. LBL1]MDH6682641.1 DNA-binding CsgD family transcriptional regulator [Rhodococcus sp. LBL2]